MNTHLQDAFTLPDNFAIGMAADPPGGSRAYVVAIENEPDDAPATFTIGMGRAEPMARNRLQITLANESGYLSSPLSEHIAAPMLYRARHAPPISAELAAEIHRNAIAAQAKRRAAYAVEREAAEVAREHGKQTAESYRPEWAKAAIVAELVEDQSDSMTDYFGSKTVRTVVLAWSKHTRDLFPEMRKAAALFGETADLADAPDKAEHREKYSMGAGFYLKQGWRNSNGWKISKTRTNWLSGPLEFTDTAKAGGDVNGAPAAAVAPVTIDSAIAEFSGGRFVISEHTHTKKGWQYWLCSMVERVERAEYDALLSAARELGGWYARPWAGIPGGFAFKVEANALRFASEHGGGGDPPPMNGGGEPASGFPKEPAQVKPAPGIGEKLRAAADSLSGKVADCYADRLANTPKRARQAAEKRNEGRVIERAQAMLRALADRHDAGDVPAVLAGITSRASVLRLAAEETDRSGGYYDAGCPLGRPYEWQDSQDIEQAAAAWALLDAPADPDRERESEVQRKIEALRFARIEGYFATPAALAVRMIESAQLSPGWRVLEPSAGSGAIADALRDHGCRVECIERQTSLCEILKLKGHAVTQGDFMETAAPGDESGQFAAVLMNPPFERGQDCAQLWHAWEFVRPGGCLVTIMGAGVTFRQNAPYSVTRERIEALGGEIEAIPAGTFKESGTGVASVMVTIWKGVE